MIKIYFDEKLRKDLLQSESRKKVLLKKNMSLLALQRKSSLIVSASRQRLAPCLSTVSDPVFSKRMEVTLRHQDELPKMPIPALRATMDRYLDCYSPLLEIQQEKDATTTAVSNFLTDDGPNLYEKLVNYDKSETNYVETFQREIFTGDRYSSYSINPNLFYFRFLELKAARVQLLS